MQKHDVEIEKRYLMLKGVLEQLAERFYDNPGIQALRKENRYDVVEQVKDYANHSEFSISFETLVDQLYEFDIAISKEDVKHIRYVADLLKIPYKRWGFVRRLVRN